MRHTMLLTSAQLVSKHWWQSGGALADPVPVCCEPYSGRLGHDSIPVLTWVGVKQARALTAEFRLYVHGSQTCLDFRTTLSGVRSVRSASLNVHQCSPIIHIRENSEPGTNPPFFTAFDNCDLLVTCYEAVRLSVCTSRVKLDVCLVRFMESGWPIPIHASNVLVVPPT